MKYDYVADQDVNQEEFFLSLGLRENVKRLFEGYSSTVFCYGTTGSGKTFTMQGAADSQSKVGPRDEKTGSPQTELSRGVAPRSLETLFRLLSESSSPDTRERFKVK